MKPKGNNNRIGGASRDAEKPSPRADAGVDLSPLATPPGPEFWAGLGSMPKSDRVLPESQGPTSPAVKAGQAGQTTLISPRILEERAPKETPQAPAARPQLKPIVGWLVVTQGPGRGHVFPLSYGMNPVGSHVEQGVRLAFGDLQIADVQALVVYDHTRRKFFLNHKGGRVATFLNGEPVLKLTQIAPHQEIIMGRTQLRLVPICGPDFDWTQK
jgi:hypothetical protein